MRKHHHFIFIDFCLVTLVLRCCWKAWAFSGCSEQGLLCSCGVWASHCDGFSCCRAQTLEHGSVVTAHRLSCPACGFSGVSRWLSGKESSCQCKRHRRCGFDPWVGKIPWSRRWPPTPIFLPRKPHGQRSLAGYNPYSDRESDTTEHPCTCGTLVPGPVTEPTTPAWAGRFLTTGPPGKSVEALL